jgi:hypothetical protein
MFFARQPGHKRLLDSQITVPFVSRGSIQRAHTGTRGQCWPCCVLPGTSAVLRLNPWFQNNIRMAQRNRPDTDMLPSSCDIHAGLKRVSLTQRIPQLRESRFQARQIQDLHPVTRKTQCCQRQNETKLRDIWVHARLNTARPPEAMTLTAARHIDDAFPS